MSDCRKMTTLCRIGASPAELLRGCQGIQLILRLFTTPADGVAGSVFALSRRARNLLRAERFRGKGLQLEILSEAEGPMQTRPGGPCYVSAWHGKAPAWGHAGGTRTVAWASSWKS